MNSSKITQKWGFGMAPISARMRKRYDAAVQSVLRLLYGHVHAQEIPLDDISEVKGMFNRSIKQDQWDWFSVSTELGSPPLVHMREIVRGLTNLRVSIKEDNGEAMEVAKQVLLDNNVLQYLHSYEERHEERILSFVHHQNAGWIYILSTREQREILKIGMTRRDVSARVKEINKATGVAIPFAVRKMFRVKNAPVAEREIFSLLANHRIRPDREFFEIDFREAVRLIEDYLTEAEMEMRHQGEVVWFDVSNGYGFIASKQNDSIFFHSTQLKGGNYWELVPGISVEFDIGRSLRGLCAFRVRITGNKDGVRN